MADFSVNILNGKGFNIDLVQRQGPIGPQGSFGVNISEADGSPNALVSNLVFPNGSVSVVGETATLSVSGLQPIASNTLLGNNTGSSATPIGLTPSQGRALLDVYTTSETLNAIRVNSVIQPTGNIFTIGEDTNSQIIRLRRRFVGAGDFSQLSIDFSGDDCRIQTQQAGNIANPIILGTNGVNRVWISGTNNWMGIGGAPTTRPLEIFAGTAAFRLQSSSAISPPAYTEIARTFDFVTWQDSTSPFNTFTDLVANSNQFNAHSIRVFVHANGTSAPIFSTMFYQTGRVGIGSEVDNNLGRLQITQDNSGAQALSHLTFRGVWNTTGAPTAFDVNQTDTASDAASLLLNLRTNGVSRFSVRKDGLISNAGSLSCGGSISCNGTLTLFDTVILRTAQNVVAMRNGTSGNVFQVFKSFTTTTNFIAFEVDAATDPTNIRLGGRVGSTGGADANLHFGRTASNNTWDTHFTVGVTDWQIRIGNQASNAPSLFGFPLNNWTSPTGGRGLGIFGRNAVVNGIHVAVGGDSFTNTGGTNILLRVGNIFQPASGTTIYNATAISPVIDQQGNANGISRGVNVTPTLTSAADWRSFDTDVNTGFAYHSSGTAPSRLGGPITWVPFTTSQTPAANGRFTVEMLTNVAGNFVYRGSDAVTRKTTLTFAYAMPAEDGSVGQFLQTNGAGVASWATASGLGVIYDNTNNNVALSCTNREWSFVDISTRDNLRTTLQATSHAEAIYYTIALGGI